MILFTLTLELPDMRKIEGQPGIFLMSQWQGVCTHFALTFVQAKWTCWKLKRNIILTRSPPNKQCAISSELLNSIQLVKRIDLNWETRYFPDIYCIKIPENCTTHLYICFIEDGDKLEGILRYWTLCVSSLLLHVHVHILQWSKVMIYHTKNSNDDQKLRQSLKLSFSNQ